MANSQNKHCANYLLYHCPTFSLLTPPPNAAIPPIPNHSTRIYPIDLRLSALMVAKYLLNLSVYKLRGILFGGNSGVILSENVYFYKHLKTRKNCVLKTY